LSGNNKLLL